MPYIAFTGAFPSYQTILPLYFAHFLGAVSCRHNHLRKPVRINRKIGCEGSHQYSTVGGVQKSNQVFSRGLRSALAF